MKRYLIIVIGIMMPILSSSQSISDTMYISNSLKDYLFEKGTFWVYEEINTNLIDSLVITEVTHTFNPEIWIKGQRAFRAQEYYQINYESKTLNYKTWDKYIGYVVVREGINWGNDGQYIFLSSYNIGDDSQGAKIVNTLDTMEINNFKFSKVTKMLIMKNKFENDQPTYYYYYYYYANGIGIIRKEICLNDTSQVQEVWNIKNWKITPLITEIQEIGNRQKILALPNPAENHIKLYLRENDISGKLFLYSLNGNIVYENIITEMVCDLDLSTILSGTYIIIIENKNSRESLKIIKR